MKYLTTLFVLFFAFSWSLEAQEFSREYGKIGKDDIMMDHYAPDDSATAVVLFDLGKSHFARTENSFDVVFERTTRIKVLSDAGIKWADVQIPYYQEGGVYEKVYDMEGSTYNFEDGRLNCTTLDLTNVYDEKLNERWNVKKFAMPNVKKGSVIEFRYKIYSQYVFNLRDWEFQWEIPVLYSEYVVKMIPFYEYTWLLQGADKFSYQDSYEDRALLRQLGPLTFHDMVSKYVMEKVPAFRDEEFISSKEDYLVKIDFQLSKIIRMNGSEEDVITTWPALVDEMIKSSYFGKYLKKSEKLAAKQDIITSLAGKSEQVRFDEIMNYVKSNFNWNNKNMVDAIKSPVDFLKDKFGNCSELNLFLAGCLRAAGIEAYPVLISTRSNGKIKYDYPYLSFFNYVLVEAIVNGKVVLVDGTNPLIANSRIPVNCINDRGLVIKKGDPQWVELECHIPSEYYTYLEINVSNPELNATIMNTASEYEALNLRTKCGGNVDDIKDLVINKYYDVIDSSIVIKNVKDIGKPYQLSYKISNEAQIIGNKIYVPPFLNETLKSNPLRQKNRTYPIDMTYPKKYTFSSTIRIPEGYEADFLPEAVAHNNDFIEFTYKVTNEGNAIIVFFEYYFKNPVYSSRDYDKIKYYFNEIVKKGNEIVVLRKT